MKHQTSFLNVTGGALLHFIITNAEMMADLTVSILTAYLFKAIRMIYY